MKAKATAFVAAAAVAISLAGCRVQINKDENGEEKTVKVDTPFGGVHVNSDQTTAGDLGLPAYPGAALATGDDKHKSADVNIGFGQWRVRVRTVAYQSADSRAKVTAFYRKALGRYGDVLVCQDGKAVGRSAVTAEGLSCEADKTAQVSGSDVSTGAHGLQLKAGSKRHQHIVGFDDEARGRTRFELIALDLPAGEDGARTSN
jgi:hypothetical protein